MKNEYNFSQAQSEFIFQMMVTKDLIVYTYDPTAKSSFDLKGYFRFKVLNNIFHDFTRLMKKLF